MKNIFDFLFMLLFTESRRNKHFNVHFQRIGPLHFLSKDGKDTVFKGKNGRKGVYYPPKPSFFLRKYYDETTFSYFVP